MSAVAKCRWCTRRHQVTLLCEPAKKILDAMYARGMEGNMPTIEFPEPVAMDQVLGGLGLNPGDRLVSQLVVKAAIVPLAGIQRPALIFTGRDPYGAILPNWLISVDADGMAALVQLVTDTADMAVRAAAKANR